MILIVRHLVEFHQWVARRIIGKKPWRKADGSCQYPLLEDSGREVVFEEVHMYFSREKNADSQYIATVRSLSVPEVSMVAGIVGDEEVVGRGGINTMGIMEEGVGGGGG